MGDFICYQSDVLERVRPIGKMPDSEIQRRLDRTINAFPEDALGKEEWQDILEWLKQVSQSTGSREVELQLSKLRRLWPQSQTGRPRLFVSHRSCDAPLALAIGKVAKQVGFDIWIDVLDPALQSLIPQPDHVQKAIATALIVEMAVLNCSHLVAAMTPATAGSWWVPYEYGRVKEKQPMTSNVASWIDAKFAQNLPVGPSGPYLVPEYLYLGDRVRTKRELKAWLTLAYRRTVIGSIYYNPAPRWRYGPTITLP
jgi:hypothetical protein